MTPDAPSAPAETLIRVPLADILRAATSRRPGYVDACLRAGRQTGEWVEFTPAAMAAVRSQFGGVADPVQGGCNGCGG